MDLLGLVKTEHFDNFDLAREEAFKKASNEDPNVTFEPTKIDPITGTEVEFKGSNGSKVAYDSAHEDMDSDKGHDKPHVGVQTSGKRSKGGTERYNYAYDGDVHPHRSNEKGKGNIYIIIKAMNNIDIQYEEIINSIKNLCITDQIIEITKEEKDEILAKIMCKFVEGNPRAWWLSFKIKAQIYSFQDEFQYKRIDTFFENNEICYFITQLLYDKLYVFESNIRNIINIIGECSFFEYYIINHSLTKLLCETDHGDLLLIDVNS